MLLIVLLDMNAKVGDRVIEEVVSIFRSPTWSESISSSFLSSRLGVATGEGHTTLHLLGGVDGRRDCVIVSYVPNFFTYIINVGQFSQFRTKEQTI